MIGLSVARFAAFAMIYTLAVAPTHAETDLEDCEATAAYAGSNVLAVANGIVITRSEVEEMLAEPLLALRQVLNDSRRQELDLEINSRLLEQEAARRGVSTYDILRADVLSLVEAPTEEEALAYYNSNKEHFPGPFDQVRRTILKVLEKQGQAEQAGAFAQDLQDAGDVSILDADLDLPLHGADPSKRLALVNGDPITLEHLDALLGPTIREIDDQLYQLQSDVLEILINDILVDKEAARNDSSIREFLEEKVYSTIEPVTDMDVRRFHDQNRDRIDVDFRDPEGYRMIMRHIEQQRSQERLTALAEQLRNAADVEIHLSAPMLAVDRIATGNQPSKGSPDAPITIVEFVDFQCPTCAYLHGVFQQLLDENPERMRLVVYNYPLSQHPLAWGAALAAAGAHEQGKYWEYVEILFENQSSLEKRDLKEYATRLGLDRERFDQALDSGMYSDQISQDRLEGQRLGIKSTPTIFLNGRLLKARTREEILLAIESLGAPATRKLSRANKTR